MHNPHRRLFILAALFLAFYALALTLSPAVRARSWDADLRWAHWLGYIVWLGGFALAQRALARHLPYSDSLLLPLIALLSGWGLLSIWRLTPFYGLRQTIWLAVALGALILGLRLTDPIAALRRYKYLWLTGGLALTALTLIFGTNPLGYGPRLWLGCCGVFLQPSEPLKLLLIIYLAAYFADRPPRGNGLSALPVLIPTLVMTGLALLLLLAQRDLGTASLFIFIFTGMVFVVTGWRLIPLLGALGLMGAGLAGYILFDVVRLRVDAWLNPWLDPSGRSYQIVQSLISVANGGLFGRGPGLGTPGFVPVAHSDFIFAAIAEESGLLGALGLLLALALLAHRGLRIARRAAAPFPRYLAAGLIAYLIAQSVLIIGGNLRLLPLTGVTLPFVSYGGSSLVTSFLAVLILLHVSQRTADSRQQTAVHRPRSAVYITPLAAALLATLAAAALTAGWWGFVRGPALLTRSDNPRRALADRSVPRGAILDRHNTPLVETVGAPGEFTRRVLTPQLGPVLGYNHAVYGETGVEAGLDTYLRGLAGNDPLTIWWHHLLYGQPPPGVDVRLTLDLQVQAIADEMLAEARGALVLLDAANGDVLAMSSHPGYDPNLLDDLWETLIQADDAPLLNRAVQGRYPAGGLWQRLAPEGNPVSWPDPPPLRLPGGETRPLGETASPLDVALVAAALTANGTRPAPRLAQAYHNPAQGWILLPPLGAPADLDGLADPHTYAEEGADTWGFALTLGDEGLTWYVGGTLPGSDGPAYALALALETADPELAERIGAAVLQAARGD